jgi:nicotinate-nucleotide pyrophosphorylase (carboxylating)
LIEPSIDDFLRAALREDLGDAGDLTTDAIIPAGATGTAKAVAHEAGVISGVELFVHTFTLLDSSVVAENHVNDGDKVDAGTVLVTLRGPLRAILTGERTALNLLSHLSGVATATRGLVGLVAGTNAKIVDTRKTTPGMRAMEKAAVLHGGGRNHRLGLYDAVLIKDNHVAAAGGIQAAISAARAHVPRDVKIEVEVDDLDQLDEALESGADSILLDNFSPADMRVAVERVAGRVPLEASGGINESNVRAIAETGVNVISVGSLTHSVDALDIGLDVE